MIENVFFELLRIAIGNDGYLSHTPTTDEWRELYAMAKKQSLVGVCFVGLQWLQSQHQCPPEKLYLQWMGMAAKIQQRNEVMNHAVVEAYQKLKEAGFKSCVMKGQSLLRFYPESLRSLRQSGDIDVLVDKTDVEVLSYAWPIMGEVFDWSYKHVHLDLQLESYIDLHYRCAMSRNLLRNARIQAWCKELKRGGFEYHDSLGYATLRNEDNVVFLLLHLLWHFLFEGIGMRQVVDYYFVLHTVYDRSNVTERLEEFGLKKFASGLMWVLQYVFVLERQFMICEPNEKEGRFLLSEILKAGNFGHYDERNKVSRDDNEVCRVWKRLFHYTRLLKHYPTEFLWIPVSYFYIRVWRAITWKKVKSAR